ncbi:MAG: universal stress protein [Thermodesulfobacteriota bacterium]|nr:universal stress protein [Thermodesulfobacteriota bacterium]
MFKHILVPSDFTEKSVKALDIAAKMAPYNLSRITLLHVIETIEDTEYEEFSDFYDKLKKRAQKEMDRMAGSYTDEGLAVDTVIAYGKRAIEIVRFANEKAVDLIVLSSHKIDMENIGQGWGTISHKVAILANCPVMMVK